MNAFGEIKDGVWRCWAGSQISDAINEGIALARQSNDVVRFEFNGVTVAVNGGSHSGIVYRDWSRALNGYIDKEIGPDYAGNLTAAELAHDAEIEAANELRRNVQRAALDEKDRQKKLVLQGALANAGPIELANAEEWQKCIDLNTDGYGSACVRYAEKWARLMQVRLGNGETIAECADETSHMADDEGLTGFMYGCAVSMLAQCWKHGEELRRWHNKDTQLGTEGDKANESGGVLNPALLSFGN